MQCFRSGVTEVFKTKEHGDEINLFSPIGLFSPVLPLLEISSLLRIISSVLEHREEKKDCCNDISVLFCFQPRAGLLQALKGFFTGWRSS